MTDSLIATDEASAPDALAGKAFRTELNPVDFLRRAAYICPEKVAMVDGERRYSYRELAERSWRLANALRSAGLRKGDRVAALLFNSSAMLEAHFGVPAAGGILVAVNHRLASAEIGYILEHSGARFLLADGELDPLVAPLALAGVPVGDHPPRPPHASRQRAGARTAGGRPRPHSHPGPGPGAGRRW